jgi:5,5'-dehydrodivanillate O-demethylase oxygenase subunit
MLTAEENRTLTQVGPGTPMGDLLRRYWQPIASVTEIEESRVKPIRLLGEDLVLYKDEGGTYGLIERACAHRLTDLAYGIIEQYGLRCPFHGWLYSETGLCIEQPLEDEPFTEEIRLRAYPVQIKAGLIWAYMGPEPAPLVPDWEPFTWEDGLVQTVFTVLPCNWLQCQENAIDPVDIEWLHLSLSRSLDRKDLPPPPVNNIEIGFDEFDHGFLYRRAPRDEAENEDSWSVGQTCLWPNGLFAGTTRSCRFEWRVPMDDTHTLSVAWFIDRVAPGHELPSEQRFYHWTAQVKEDPDAEYSDFVTTHSLNQKFALWLTQEPIVDRTKEHLLDTTDQGVIMLRSKYFTQITLVSDGGEPKSVLRDPNANKALPLPFSGPRLEGEVVEASPAGTAPTDAPAFPFLAGQPPEVEALYRKVLATWEAEPAGDDAPSQKTTEP